MERTGWSLSPKRDLRATTPSAALTWLRRNFLDAAATPPHEEGIHYLSSFHKELEMLHLHVTFARGAHDVVEYGRKLENLEAAVAEIAVSAYIAVAESKNVTELVR